MIIKGQEVKVGSRAVAMFEKESGMRIQEFMQFAGEGKMPKVELMAILVKASTNLSIEQVYDAMDEQPEIYTQIGLEYSNWCKKAWQVGESGNSDSSTTAQS